MFMLTAFDRPPKEYNWEEVFNVLMFGIAWWVLGTPFAMTTVISTVHQLYATHFLQRYRNIFLECLQNLGHVKDSIRIKREGNFKVKVSFPSFLKLASY